MDARQNSKPNWEERKEVLKMLCDTCGRQEFCSELCKEAENFANQDQPNYHKPGDFHFTPSEKSILMLLMGGKTRQQIAKRLKLSKDSLRHHLCNLRKKRDVIDLRVDG